MDLTREEIFDDVATKMNLYFIMGNGSDELYKSFDEAFLAAEFKQKEVLPEFITQAAEAVEKRKNGKAHFSEIAHEIWKKQRSDNEREKRRCLWILTSCFD